MYIINRQILVGLVVLVCNYGLLAQQQVVSEKVAENSAAAMEMLHSAEHAESIEVDQEGVVQRKNNRKRIPKKPSYARIPTDFRQDAVEPSKMSKTFTIIEQAISRGDQFVARNMLVDFVSRWPANTHARLILAKLEILLGNFQLAQSVLLPLMSDENSGWQPWFWSATAKLEEGLFERARAELKQAVARDASVPEIWIQQAVVEQKTGNHIGAVQLLQVARQLAPQNPQVHLGLAFSNEQIGAYSSALQNYHQFMQTSKDTNFDLYQPRVVRRISELIAAL